MQLINPRIFYYLRSFQKKAWLTAVGLFLLEAFKLLPPYIFALIIDQLVRLSPQSFEIVVRLMLFFLIASIIAHIFEMLLQRFWNRFWIDIHRRLRELAGSKLLHLSMAYHENHNAGADAVRIQRGVDKMSELLFQTRQQLLPTLFQILLVFTTIALFHFTAALAFIFLVPFFIWYSFAMAKRLQPLRLAYKKLEEQAAGELVESAINIRTVQDFSQERMQDERHRFLLGGFMEKFVQRTDFEDWFMLWQDILLATARVGTMFFYSYLVIIGQLSPGMLVFFVTLTEKSFLSLYRVGRILSWSTDAVDGVNLLVDLFDHPEEVQDRPDAREMEQVTGKVTFENVSFTYDKKNQEVLQNISFSIPAKKTVALVGRSGSGKSTIVKLLFRHFDISGGSVRVDDTDIREVTKSSLRQHLAIVAQDIDIFNTSVLENIRFGKPDATYEEVYLAAKIAHAHDFISQFPEGYQTLVGERGVKLSGGQKQRIGIARAILKRPKILVFDEATSSLDSESEQLIQKAMWEIGKTSTMLIIAHRLSTIRHADQIIVLDEGKIVESGTHSELIRKKGGLFAHMHELQVMGEIRE